MMRTTFFLLLLLLLPEGSVAQGVLDEATYLELVLEHHPKSLQGQLFNDQADFALRAAKGAFDPVLAADWATKQYDGKQYYSIGNSGLKWPTRFGLSLQTGFLWSDGVFLNPQRTLPDAGQALIGAELPLLNGLLTDAKRTGLRQAEIGLLEAQAAQQQLLNDLLVKAAEQYWNWNLAARKQQLLQQALQISMTRFEGVRESYLNGDKPALDTLEAWIQVQQRSFELQEAENEWLQESLQLQNFVWNSDDPADRSFNWQPNPARLERIEPPLSRQALLDSMNQFQADIRLIALQQQQLQLDKRLAREQLKPTLNLKYQLLADGWQWGALPFSDVPQEELLLQNYALGLEFAYPLFQRKERNKVRMIQVKEQQLELKFQEIRRFWEVQVDALYTQLQYLAGQVGLYEEIANNYFRLLEGEQELFRLGESSLFVINSREQKWLDAQQKLIKLQANYQKTYAKLKWAAGGDARLLAFMAR